MFAALFTRPMSPVEALARLRGLQIQALSERWLIEQDDYRDTYRLATLLAAGHASLDQSDIDLRLHWLSARDILLTEHPTIWTDDPWT